MKTPSRPHFSGFTLIELMTVITIIILLAGLVVGGMGFVSDRQAKEKARVQIALLSKALEEYKLDNGTYPPTSNSPTGTNQSTRLYNALYLDGAKDSTNTKRIYLPQLDPVTGKQGWTTGSSSTSSSKIYDPWNNEYCYRTATNSSGAANADTQNPDFDLWTMGKDGKSKARKNDDPGHADNKDDIRNF